MYTEEKIREITNNALEAFWESVAEQLPEIKTGDMAPGDIVPFEMFARQTVETWIENNKPEKPFSGLLRWFYLKSINKQ
jgi:hypothetical protein